MTLRIERDSDEKFTVLRLIGEMQSDDLEGLKAQIDASGVPVLFDLDELTSVDLAVVRFLGACEKAGVELINCPPYILEWVKRERAKE